MIIHTRVPKTKSVCCTSEREQTTVGLDCANEAFEELADILLDGHLVGSGEELDDELEESPGSPPPIKSSKARPR